MQAASLKEGMKLEKPLEGPNLEHIYHPLNSDSFLKPPDLHNALDHETSVCMGDGSALLKENRQDV